MIISFKANTLITEKVDFFPDDNPSYQKCNDLIEIQ